MNDPATPSTRATLVDTHLERRTEFEHSLIGASDSRVLVEIALLMYDVRELLAKIVLQTER